MRRVLTFISILCVASSAAYALDWNGVRRGDGVELIENLSTNKLLSYTGLQCRVGNRTFWPKLTVGPSPGVDGVHLRFLTVIEKFTDLLTYRLYFQSEQLPCGCVLWIDQTPEYLRGAGDDFKMLKAADSKAMLSEPSIPTACGNLPDWFNRMTPMDEDSPGDETISL